MSELPPINQKVGMDTSGYKTGAAEMQRQIRVIESGFRASAAALGDWGKSSEGLELRIKSLSEKIDVQKQKVAAAQKEYQRLADSGKASAKSLELMQITINEETEKLNKMQSELSSSEKSLKEMGNASQTASTKVGDLKEKEDQATSSTSKFKSVVSGLGSVLKLGATAIAGIATAAGAAAGALGALVVKASDAAGELVDTSNVTGLSTEKLQELAFVGDQVGVSTETMTGALSKLTRSMATAKDETEKNADSLNTLAANGLGPVASLFKGLGVEVSDSSGSLRDSNEVFSEVQNALAKIPNITERNAASMNLFGKTADQISDKDLPKLINKMDDARTQFAEWNSKLNEGNVGPTTEAFTKLGVSFTDSSGNLRSAQDVFNEAIQKLGTISNETERDAIAMEIFGKSAQELNPLIKTSASEMNALTQKAHDMGAVVADKDVNALESFGDSLSGLKAGLKGTLTTLAAGFLPGLQGLVGSAETYLGKFSKIVSGSNGDLGKMASGVGGLIGEIVNDVGQQAPKMLQAGLNILQGIITAITTNLPTLLPAAVNILTSLMNFLVTNLPILVQAGVSILLALVNGIVPMLPQLVTMAVQILITLANGITAALPTLIPAISAAIPEMILALINALPLLIQAAAQLILALAQGLVAAIPILLPYIPQIFDAIVNALMVSLPIIGQAAVQIFMALYNGLYKNLPLMGKVGGELIGSLIKGVVALAGQLISVGAQIVSGIWQGVAQKRDWFNSQVRGFFTGIISGVKSALGIHSPSRVFADIGQNMALGLGNGFQNSLGDISSRMNALVGNLGSVNLQTSLSPAMASASAMVEQPITINAYMDRELDYYKLAQKVSEVQKRNRK